MTVLDQAQNFAGGPVAAARRRDRWAQREANATDPEQREQYREAIADLEARYPDIAEVPVGGAEAFARERGHGRGSRSPVHEGRRRTGNPAPAGSSKQSGRKTSQPPPAPTRKPVPGLDPAARRSRSQRAAATGRPTPRVDRAIGQTGIPAAAGTGSSTLMAALGATVGLSLLYLLLSSAETPGSGAKALPRMIDAVTRALGRFLSLQDVFPTAAGIPAGMVEGPGGLEPEGPPGAYTHRFHRGEVAGPPTPPRFRRKYRRQAHGAKK